MTQVERFNEMLALSFALTEWRNLLVARHGQWVELDAMDVHQELAVDYYNSGSDL
jgi:hypothetical protein